MANFLKAIVSFFFLFYLIHVHANESITPTISPEFFTYNQSITVTYDVTGTSLAALNDAYAWVWLPNGSSVNAKWNVNPASSDASRSNNAKFVKSVVNGRTLFTLTFIPASFFEGDISAQTKMGILLKGNDWANGQTTDYIANFWDGNFQVRLIKPQQTQLFVNNLQSIDIEAETPVTASFSLYIDNTLVDEVGNATAYTYTHVVTETSGIIEVRLVSTTGAQTDEISFDYILASSSELAPRPSGIVPGINYSADPSKATLCLWAPAKTSVYAVGDFSDWEVSSTYLMKRDGEFFWIEIANLEPGEEYAFQYLVEQTLRVADPYADKILDPDDQYIPESTYPSLKAFPVQALSSKWYENRVSVLQTNQPSYQWQVSSFQKPPKENLIVYELLIRDFFEGNNRNYQSLIDTLGYLKRLGINAIELMPIMEFNGNEGWGYNPTFMFAPDKFYGSKNKLKEFIDKCHQEGIAVILDIALNHQDVPNTYAAMYFDFEQFVPVNNPWFNTTPKHPFNVFFDMNHESSYTKAYVDTINHYWLNEYKVDGFRFDLSKGFTQKNSGSDVGGWSAYDASRIALLKRMADKIWEHTPDAYVILEHLGVNEEERELAQYRANEGKGMMLWGKMTEQYNQNSMGYSSNASIAGVYHKSKSWSVPHLVSYMESHDEERLMFKNLEYGNASLDYSVKEKKTALDRMEATFATFLTIPGPKMLWQFGELGFEYSINRCPDGSISNDCRLANKPTVWEYLQEEERQKLLARVSDLLRLRKEYSVFSTGDASFSESIALVKAITLKSQPYTSTPTSTEEMNVQIVANFDVVQRTFDVVFPHTGTWYDYAHGGMPYEVTNTTHSVTLSAGGYFLFTDVPIAIEIVTEIDESSKDRFSIYPNPSSGLINLAEPMEIQSLLDTKGKPVAYEWLTDTQLIIREPQGIYLLKGFVGSRGVVIKIIIQ